MDCTRTTEWLQDAIDGRLPPREAEELREHLSGCAACRAEEESLRQVGDLLRLWAAVRTEERGPQLHAMWTRVKTGIEETRKPRVASALLRWFWTVLSFRWNEGAVSAEKLRRFGGDARVRHGHRGPGG